MIINNNIAALNTYNQLSRNDSAMSKSLEKLSSGYQINTAADDAAGLAISQKMQAQINGLDQANDNAQDAISLIQTAEGALNQTDTILQRMRELAVQASNDTLTDEDRSNIQLEIDQLSQQIDDIGNDTQFNTKTLLNGGAGIQATQTVGTGISVVTGGAGVKAGGDLVTTAVTKADNAKVVIDGGADLKIGSAGANITVNGVTVKLAANADSEAIVKAFNDVSGQSGVTASYDAVNFTLTLSSAGVGSNQQMTITGLQQTATTPAAGDTFGAGGVTITANGSNLLDGDGAIGAAAVNTTYGKNATVTIDQGNTSGSDVTYSARGNQVTIHGGDFDGLVLDVESVGGNANKLHIDANNSLNMQIGANEGQQMNISISDMRGEALGVNNLDLTNSKSASEAITTIDKAISKVSAENSKLGAYQNRLEYTSDNLTTSSENLTTAEANIRDVDMAKEMMEYTKDSILSQAATSMLAQANQMPQNVLKLLQ